MLVKSKVPTPGSKSPVPKKEPVIIVPGILGSRLNRVSDGKEIWLDTPEMFSPVSIKDDYLNDIKLDNEGKEIMDHCRS